MCNLYRMDQSAAEIAKLFNTAAPQSLNVSTEIYPGYPGLVFAEDKLQPMIWGFPLFLKSKRTGEPLKPRPINNARTDKLDSYMWRDSFQKRRCLIPVSRFAEAEGAAGSKTRTWFSKPGENVLICAGLWRDSDEWGPVYSMVMIDANETVAPVHNRMPVIVDQPDQKQWIGPNSNDARALCLPYEGKLHVDRTQDGWRS